MSLFLRNSSLLAGALWLAGAAPALAQQPAVRNLATDTLQPPNACYHHPVSHVRTTSGTDLYVFISALSSHPHRLEFTWRNPLALPRPKPVLLELAQVQWVQAGRYVYEPVRVASTKPRKPYQPAYLAWRRAVGIRVELFDSSWPRPKASEAIPIAGLVVSMLAKIDSSQLNHVWLRRRPGAATMTPVPVGKSAALFLADYVADVPELAATIRQAANTPGYAYDDLPALVARYNAWPATSRSQP